MLEGVQYFDFLAFTDLVVLSLSIKPIKSYWRREQTAMSFSSSLLSENMELHVHDDDVFLDQEFHIPVGYLNMLHFGFLKTPFVYL